MAGPGFLIADLVRAADIRLGLLNWLDLLDYSGINYNFWGFFLAPDGDWTAEIPRNIFPVYLGVLHPILIPPGLFRKPPFRDRRTVETLRSASFSLTNYSVLQLSGAKKKTYPSISELVSTKRI